MTTTGNIRADALTDDKYEAVEWASKQAGSYARPIEGETLMMKRERSLKELLTRQAKRHVLTNPRGDILPTNPLSTPVEQPAAAPIDERAIAARTDSAGVSEIILSTIVRAARKGKSYVEGYGKAHQFLKDAGLLVDGSAATAPAPSPADERAATFEEWFSSLSPQRRALIGDVRDVRMGWEAARAGEKS